MPPRGWSWTRIAVWSQFIGSAALVAVALDLSWTSPWLGFLLGVLAAMIAVPQILARRRIRRILVSGDINAVLEVWSRSLDRLPHRETMAPLIVATAFAAHGFTDRAREALSRAARGDAWEGALEHRLFVEALLDAFEGERDLAVKKAESLAELPLPDAGPLLRSRVALLRAGLGALARAFAHTTRPGDVELLQRAGKKSPLVHWPMQYASAVAMIDHGRTTEARRVLQSAPLWPEESAFHAFQQELVSMAGTA
jgi:hypothetical protein